MMTNGSIKFIALNPPDVCFKFHFDISFLIGIYFWGFHFRYKSFSVALKNAEKNAQTAPQASQNQPNSIVSKTGGVVVVNHDRNLVLLKQVDDKNKLMRKAGETSTIISSVVEDIASNRQATKVDADSLAILKKQRTSLDEDKKKILQVKIA